MLASPSHGHFQNWSHINRSLYTLYKIGLILADPLIPKSMIGLKVADPLPCVVEIDFLFQPRIGSTIKVDLISLFAADGRKLAICRHN